MKAKIVDTLILLLLVATAGLGARAYLSLDQYPDISDICRTILRAKSISSIAIPKIMSSSSNTYAEDGIKTVIYDERSLHPQFFSFHRTPYAVISKTSLDSRMGKASYVEQDLGKFWLLKIKLDHAALSPLQKGQHIVQDYKKSFLSDSKQSNLELLPNKPIEYSFQLDKGNYQFTIEAFQPSQDAELIASVNIAALKDIVKTYKLKPLVHEPMIFAFSVPKGSTSIRPVKITLLASSTLEKTPAIVQRVELTKE